MACWGSCSGFRTYWTSGWHTSETSPPLGRPCMAFQPFRSREPRRILSELTRRARVVKAQPSPQPEKRQDRQPSAPSRGPTSRQNVVWSGAVVSQHLPRLRSNKHRSVVVQPWGDGRQRRRREVQLQVLGRDRLTRRHTFLDAAYADDA